VLCRSVAEPQCNLGAQASLSRTRSLDHGVAAQLLVDDVRTATPPPAADARGVTLSPTADSRTTTPPPVADAGARGAIGDVRTSTSRRVNGVDPISVMPGGAEKDLVRDQAQIDQAPKGPRTSGAQVPNSSLSSPRLSRREIDWNDTPW
jgi:hypothetical protein